MAQPLGTQPPMEDMGWKLPITVQSDGTAAIGIARRKGLGKIRHLDVTDLWIQDEVKSKQLELKQVLGADTPADIFTKYIARSIRDKALSTMSMLQMGGRPACAPAAMSA